MVDIEPEANGGTLLCGHFHPHPHVWAASVGTVAMSAFGALVSLSYGYAQWIMGQLPTALWGLFGSVILATVAIITVCIGGWHETRQAKELQEFLHRSLPARADQRAPALPDPWMNRSEGA